MTFKRLNGRLFLFSAFFGYNSSFKETESSSILLQLSMPSLFTVEFERDAQIELSKVSQSSLVEVGIKFESSRVESV